MPILQIRDKDGKFVPIPAIKGEDGKSAYEQAKDGGFQGTEQEFIQLLSALSTSMQLQLLELGDEQSYLEDHVANKNNPHGVTAEQIGSLKIYYSFSALNKELGTAFDVTTPIETIIQAMPDNTGLIGDINTVDKGETPYPTDAHYGILSIYKVRANRVQIEYVSNTAVGGAGYNRRWVGQYNAGVFGGFREVFTETHPPTADQVGALSKTPLVGADVLAINKDGWYYGSDLINVPTDTKNGYVRVMTNMSGEYRAVTWQPRDAVTEYTNILFEGKWKGWVETVINPFMSTLYLEGDVYKPIVIKNVNSYYALEKYRTVDGRPCRMDVGLGVYPSAVLQVAIGEKGDAEAPEQYTHRLDLRYDGLDFTYKDENNAEVKNKMFGEHNKPVGSYTGDGASERHITTGGIGNALAVWSSADYDFGALIMPSGAMYFRGGNLQVSGKNICYFENGSLHIYGNAIAFNDNNRTYNYQVL